MVKTCLACKVTVPKVPLRILDLPNAPWQKLSDDFCGPFPSREYLMVVIDGYTRYPVVEIVKSVSADEVIPNLDTVNVWYT